MRFERISIPAYGRFENMELCLPRTAHDLQVIYGPNEAGKSTLLRAIRGLLFGIDAKTKDNFLHDHEDLLIGAELSAGPDRSLKFYRRKGNRNTLLDADKKALPDDALAPFLGVVDASYFSTMFGMGSEELRERGRAVLAGKDKLGEVLFSASMGGTPVERVIAALRDDAERIFKGRTITNVSLRPALKAYDELMKDSKEAIVKPDEWAALEAEWRDAIERKQALGTALAALKTQHEWLTRCQDALPTMTMLDEAEAQSAAVTEVPLLSTAALQQAQSALDQQRSAGAEVKRLEHEVARLALARNACATRPDVLAQATAIERLHQDLGVYRQHRKALPAMDAEVRALEQSLRVGMLDFELSGDVAKVEGLRLPKAAEAAYKEAAKALTASRVAVETSRMKIAEVEAALASQERQLAALGEQGVEPLRAALAETEGMAEVLRAVPELEVRLRKEERAVAAAHALLHDAPSDFAATHALVVPAKALLRRYEMELDAVLKEQGEASRAIAEACDAQRVADDALATLQRGRHIPSLDELRAAREAREEAWQAVRASFEASAARRTGNPLILHAAFAAAMRHADDIADALREQAQVVAEGEHHRGQVALAQRDLVEAQVQRMAADQAEAAWQMRWIAEWQKCGIDSTGRSPAEMMEWREHWLAFRDAYDAWQHGSEQLAVYRERIAAAEALLSGQEGGTGSLSVLTDESRAKRRSAKDGHGEETLPSVNGLAARATLAALLAEAKKRVQQADEAAGQRRAALRSLDELRTKREALVAEQNTLDKRLTEARSAWMQKCAALGFAAETSPESGLELASGRARLVELAAQCSTKQRELNAAQDTTRAFEADTKATGEALALTAANAEAMEALLWQSLVEARAAKARHQDFQTQFGVAEQALAKEQVIEAAANEALKAAQHLAGAADLEHLPAALEAIAKKAALHEQTQMLRSTLRGQARGVSAEDFISQVRAEEAGTLGTRLAESLAEIATKTTQLASQQEAVRVLEQRKAGYEQAADEAANYRQQAESKAAVVANDAARFVRLQMAIHLLERQIETFRKANQGPLLKRSGEIFARFTRSSFAGLGVTFDADDEPVLTGLRADGKAVRVEGMSEGTRDQLYLALRFAGLERHLATHTPMPLILDDLLITFDDERAAAILPALAELSQRTQVILFTHHQHLVELCGRVLPGQFAMHELG